MKVRVVQLLRLVANFFTLSERKRERERKKVVARSFLFLSSLFSIEPKGVALPIPRLNLSESFKFLSLSGLF